MRRDLRRLLAPRWLAWHATLVVVLVAFGVLGEWQLDGFRQGGSGAEQAERPTADVSTVLEPGGRLTTGDVGRPVEAVGRYDAHGQLLVPARSDGDREGYLVVTPLVTDDGVLPVNRGWVAAPTDPATEPADGQVTLRGVLQASETQEDSAVDPFADLPDDQIPYLATVVLLDRLPYAADELYDGYLALRAEEPPPAAAPRPVPPREADDGVGRWRNLGYALQWWFFAGAAVFFWWAVIRRSLREERPVVPAGDS